MSASNQRIPVDIPQPASSQTLSDDSATIIAQALQRGRDADVPFAGSVTPPEAWTLFQRGDAVLVDVRSAEERKFVGQVPGTLHVAWATGIGLVRNPRFVGELGGKLKKDQHIMFLCRSGKRSAFAAEAARKAGFSNVFNVLEGFEGEIDAAQQRGLQGGWRFHRLPWTQD